MRITDFTASTAHTKWQSLEHSGVTFFPRYEPHGVKLLYKGKPVSVSSEVEEVCNWWANIDGSEFAEKELVLKNFSESFLGMIKMG